MKSTENIERLLNNNSVNKEKVFFNTVNKLSNRQRKNIPPLRDPDTDVVIAQTDEEIADELHRFYCKKLKRNKYNAEHETFHNYVDNFIENYKTNDNQRDSILNREFTHRSTACSHND